VFFFTNILAGFTPLVILDTESFRSRGICFSCFDCCCCCCRC